MAFGISLNANTFFSQGVYINSNVGYGFKMSSQNINYFDFSNSNRINNILTYEQINVSLGKGLNFGGAFGYMFNRNFGTELGISYLKGGKSISKDTFDGQTDYGSLSSKMFRIIPSLILTYDCKKLNPYVKLGMIIGSGSILYEHNSNWSGNISSSKTILTGGLAFGLNSATGIIFKPGNKMSIFGEINMVNLSYSPSKAEIIELIFNNIDFLPDTGISGKQIEFVDKYTADASFYRRDLPRKELTQKFPFGSISFCLGMRLDFIKERNRVPN